MFFSSNGKGYTGRDATEIIWEIARDDNYRFQKNGGIRDFLRIAHEKLADRIPARELDLSAQVSDELLAFNYLCLLDEYGVGVLSAENSLPD